MAKLTAVKRRRPSIRSGARERVMFEMTPRIHTLLKDEAARREVTQIVLLEELIKEAVQ